MDGYPWACLGVAGSLVGFKRLHGDEEGGECGGGIGALGGLCGPSSLARSRLVINNDEGSAVEKGVREDRSTHAGGGVILVGGFFWVGDANTGRLDREGVEAAEVGGDGGRGGAT